MMRKFFILGFVLVDLVGLYLWLARESTPEPAGDLPTSTSESATTSSKRVAKQPLVLPQKRIAAPPSHREVPLPAPEAVLRIKQRFSRAYEWRDRVDTAQKRQVLFEELASDHEAKLVMQQVLMDKQRATQLFGSDQAVVRVMAVKFFKYLAEQGDRESLRVAIGQAQKIPLKQMTSDPGNMKDFRDLVYFYVKSYTPVQVKEELASILEDIGYRRLNPQLQTAVDEELFLFLSPHFLSDTPAIIAEAKA